MFNLFLVIKNRIIIKIGDLVPRCLRARAHACAYRVPWGGGPWVLPISVVAQGEQEELHDGIFVSHHKEGHAAPSGTAPGERRRDLDVFF